MDDEFSSDLQNGESKPIPAWSSTEEKLKEPDKNLKVVYDEPTDSSGWTYWIQYVDQEVVSGDELPSLKESKEPSKWKLYEASDGYDPGSPTSESEPANKKQAVAKNGESKPIPAEKWSSAEEKPKEALLEPDKYLKVVYEDPADFTSWTYSLQYIDKESDVEEEREANCPKYADNEKRRGSKKKCLKLKSSVCSGAPTITLIYR